jgi:putative SOS response-associated peptidase YedK
MATVVAERLVNRLAVEGITAVRVHERMPVILEEPDWPAWLGQLGGIPPR